VGDLLGGGGRGGMHRVAGYRQRADRNSCGHGPTAQHGAGPGHAVRTAGYGRGDRWGDELGMSLTTAGGAVTRQLSIPFTPGTWSGFGRHGARSRPDRDL